MLDREEESLEPPRISATEAKELDADAIEGEVVKQGERPTLAGEPEAAAAPLGELSESEAAAVREMGGRNASGEPAPQTGELLAAMEQEERHLPPPPLSAPPPPLRPGPSPTPRPGAERTRTRPGQRGERRRSRPAPEEPEAPADMKSQEPQSILPEVYELFTKLVGLTEKAGNIKPEVQKKIKAAFGDTAQAQMLRELLETHLLEGLQEIFGSQEEKVFGPVLGRTRAYRNIIDALEEKDEVRERLRAAIKRTGDLRKEKAESGEEVRIGKEPLRQQEEDQLLAAMKLLRERKEEHAYKQGPSEPKTSEEIKDMGLPEEVGVREQARNSLRGLADNPEANEGALVSQAVTLVREDLAESSEISDEDWELLEKVFGNQKGFEERRNNCSQVLEESLQELFREWEGQEQVTAGQIRRELQPFLIIQHTLIGDVPREKRGKSESIGSELGEDEAAVSDNKLQELQSWFQAESVPVAGTERESSEEEPEKEPDTSERLRVEMDEALEKLNSQEELPQEEREALALQVLTFWVEAKRINADWAQGRVVLRGVAAVAAVDAPEEVRDSIADLISRELEEILEGVTGNE